MPQRQLDPRRRQSPSGRRLADEGGGICITEPAVIVEEEATATFDASEALATYPATCEIACRVTVCVATLSEAVTSTGSGFFPLRLSVVDGNITAVSLNNGVTGGVSAPDYFLHSLGSNQPAASSQGTGSYSGAPAGIPDTTFTLAKSDADNAVVAATFQVCFGPHLVLPT